MRGLSLPSDNGYALLKAVAVATNAPAGEYLLPTESLASIGGRPQGPGMIRVSRDSRLRIRTPRPADWCGLLGGRLLDVAGHLVQLGTPEVKELTPSPVLISRMVTFRLFHKTGPGVSPPAALVLESAHVALERLGVAGRVEVRTIPRGPREGEPLRHITRIADSIVVGFSLQVSELSAEGSVVLQSAGLGGKRHSGCGWFDPLEARRAPR
jgi:CRISPR-associated protein Cas6